MDMELFDSNVIGHTRLDCVSELLNNKITTYYGNRTILERKLQYRI